MPLTPTTLLAVREGCAAVITAMGTPAHAEYQDAPWNRVRSVKEVPGAMRNYLIRPLPSDEVTETHPYGDGYTRVSTIQIWTSYANLADDEDGVVISDDARQLYYHLDSNRAAQPDGVIHWVPVGWTYEDETPGKVWGYHAFQVYFLASDENAAT